MDRRAKVRVKGLKSSELGAPLLHCVFLFPHGVLAEMHGHIPPAPPPTEHQNGPRLTRSALSNVIVLGINLGTRLLPDRHVSRMEISRKPGLAITDLAEWEDLVGPQLMI